LRVATYLHLIEKHNNTLEHRILGEIATGTTGNKEGRHYTNIHGQYICNNEVNQKYTDGQD